MNRTEFKAQIEVLRSLKDNLALDSDELFWVLDSDGLDWLKEAFQTKYPEHLPLPRLYERHGGVCAEWDVEDYVVTLNINLGSKRVFWYEESKGRNDDYGKQLYLNEAAGWDWLIDRLSSLLTIQTAEQRKEMK